MNIAVNWSVFLDLLSGFIIVLFIAINIFFAAKRIINKKHKNKKLKK